MRGTEEPCDVDFELLTPLLAFGAEKTRDLFRLDLDLRELLGGLLVDLPIVLVDARGCEDQEVEGRNIDYVTAT